MGDIGHGEGQVLFEILGRVLVSAIGDSPDFDVIHTAKPACSCAPSAFPADSDGACDLGELFSSFISYDIFIAAGNNSMLNQKWQIIVRNLCHGGDYRRVGCKHRQGAVDKTLSNIMFYRGYSENDITDLKVIYQSPGGAGTDYEIWVYSYIEQILRLNSKLSLARSALSQDQVQFRKNNGRKPAGS